jgi:hypothetical protein
MEAISPQRHFQWLNFGGKCAGRIAKAADTPRRIERSFQASDSGIRRKKGVTVDPRKLNVTQVLLQANFRTSGGNLAGIGSERGWRRSENPRDSALFVPVFPRVSLFDIMPKLDGVGSTPIARCKILG